jgi:peptidoglycan/LPS O-acetylase OafA/YrhL
MLLTYFGWKDVGLAGKQSNIFLQLVDWFYACRDFVQPFHDYNREFDLLHRYQSVFWTLPLEIYGSFVCYVTIMTVARITHPVKRTATVLIISWFALVKANWWSLNFLAGMLHGEFIIWQEKTETLWSTGGIAKYFWGLIFIWAFYVAGLPDAQYDQYNLPGFDWYYSHVPDSWKDIEHGGRFWWMISGICLTVSISQLPTLKRIFETRICQYLGRISYMLYLVHSYVFVAFGKWWKDTLMVFCGTYQGNLPGTDTPMLVLKGPWWYIWYLGFWIVMLPLVLVVSGQVTKYIDDPSIQFAKWLEGTAIRDDKEDYTTSVPLSTLAS